MIVLGLIALALFALGFYTRNFWIIAKLGATTPWLFLCSGITIVAFIMIYWLADLKGKAKWFSFIKPAGTDTLLCYLIPYFAYATVVLFSISWPEFMLTGIVGLIKSFVFVLLCVAITGFLSKNGVRLKL
jgi:predicted anti-sigma-YlaC factor YlaD